MIYILYDRNRIGERVNKWWDWGKKGLAVIADDAEEKGDHGAKGETGSGNKMKMTGRCCDGPNLGVSVVNAWCSLNIVFLSCHFFELCHNCGFLLYSFI